MPEYRHLYVHVPFCEVICHYCHFYTARASEARQEEFFAALGKHLDQESAALAPGLEAVYFGGGTPAASPPALVHQLLDRFRPRLTPDTEITLEVNPSNVTRESARAWREAGINRISLGVQSLSDSTLKRLGRAHSALEARRAVELCRNEIENVSCDVMFAVPEQPRDEPAHHARELVGLGAGHISAYHLTLEPEHFLHQKLPSDAFAWEQIRALADALPAPGFHHYEIASFARPGLESRNNRNYWSGGPYLALGPSAHGFDGGNRRWTHVSDWREYIRRVEEGESPRAWTEELTPEQRRIEVIFTSLRTSTGLDLDRFRAVFGEDLRETKAQYLHRWQDEKLARLEKNFLVLTFEGRMLADEIAQKLL